MKLKFYFVAVFLLLFVFSGDSQANTFPDTFPNVKGIPYVIVRTDNICSRPATKNIVTSKYFFDADGSTIAWFSICNNKTCGKQLYTYVNNKLASFKNYNSWITYNQTTLESRWDSTLLSNAQTYKYVNNKISKIQFYDEELKKDNNETNYYYDTKGNLAREETIMHWESLRSELNNFPVTTTDLKEYAYKDTIILVRYLKNGQLLSNETITTNKSGRILKSELKSTAGNLLKKFSYKYDAKMQLIKINSFDTGQGGFGDTYDLEIGDRIILKYDGTGKLITKEKFYKGKLCEVEKYVYSK